MTCRYVAEWAAKARQATAQRDRWICTMHDKGASYRAIAGAAGMSHAAIQRIVKRRSD